MSIRNLYVLLFVFTFIGGQAEAASPKLGWAGGDAGDHNASNASWYYRWWHEKPPSAAGTLSEFVPLIKFPNNLQNKLNIVANFSDVDTLLYLNEPERANQSNVTVNDALTQWYDVQAALPNHKLVSPGVSDDAAGISWLTNFMNVVETRNANTDPNDDMRVDSIAFHWYGASNPNAVSAANNFLNRVEWYHTTFNRPVWITEFAMHDWEGDNLTSEMIQANAQFLEIVLPELESRSYVERYSYYNWFDDAAIFDQANDRMPTPIGDVYMDTIQSGETRDLQGISLGADVVYMREGTLTNTGPAITEAMRALDALEGINTITASTDWGLADRNDAYTKVRPGATLRKTGLGAIKLNRAINNQGTIHHMEGTLSLEDGPYSGDGRIIVDQNATLEVSAQDGRGTYILANSDLELHGDVSGPLILQQNSMLISKSNSATFGDNLTLRSSIIEVGGQGFSSGPPNVFPISTGLQLNYDAATDTPGDNQWENTAGSIQPMAFASNTIPTSVSDPAWQGITAAYSIAGSGPANGLNGYFESGGPRSQQDATFEIVFKVDDTNAGTDQVLFEAGGTNRGIAFVLNNDTLTFNVDGNSGDIDLSHTLSTGWHQAVGVIDLASGNDTVSLFINGAQVGTLNGQTIGDWAGGNLAGIGAAGDVASGLSSGNGNAFHGEIAIARYYNNQSFDLSEVQQNYLAITSPLPPVADRLLVEGDLRVETGSEIRLDISESGIADSVQVDGALVLVDAVLFVSSNDQNFSLGDTFNLFDAASTLGEFNSITLPALSNGLSWNTELLSVDGSIQVVLTGDYNVDGFVDAADYTVWRDQIGQSVEPYDAADPNGDGVVDQLDYDEWMNNFGNASSITLSTAIPEPSSFMMLLPIVFISARYGRLL